MSKDVDRRAFLARVSQMAAALSVASQALSRFLDTAAHAMLRAGSHAHHGSIDRERTPALPLEAPSDMLSRATHRGTLEHSMKITKVSRRASLAASLIVVVVTRHP